MRSTCVAIAALLTMSVAISPAGAQRRLCGTRTTAACTAPGFTFLTVSAGFGHTCGVTTEGVAYCWGDGRKGALGDGKREVSRLPQRVVGGHAFVDIAAGGDFTCARTVDGQVLCWGGERPVPGWPTQSDVPRAVRLAGPAASIAVGRRHACVLDNEGQASCWGWNVDGETGIGSSGIGAAMVATPTLVETAARFSGLSAGLGFTCGVTIDAAVMCWGSNVDATIGPHAPDRCGEIGPIPCATRPVPVPLPERASRVSAGSTHACALSQRGRVFCWGSNGAGQVGAFGPGVPTVPVPSEVVVGVPDAFVSVSSGGIHSCALTSSRRVYCWGAYEYFGRDEAAAAPSVAAGGTQFRAISTGQVHACGLDTSGRVLCWGDTILGALGIR